MKKVVSVSLGASSRDHTYTAEFLGEKFEISRIGTDGDTKKMMDLFRELDPQVDAFGMGGGDIYLRPGKRTYLLKDPYIWSKAAPTKPVCDGAFFKSVIEPIIIHKLFTDGILNKNMKALVMTAVDRYALAKSFADEGCQYTFGDMAFSLGIPWAIRSMKMINFLAVVLLPVITKLPYHWLYPLGEKQDKLKNKPNRFFSWADVIAGDLHYIRKNMPLDMKGKIICTNTTTTRNIEEFKERGAKTVVTFTPDMNGRTFGANVMEAMISVILGKHPKDTTDSEYKEIISKLGMDKPNIVNL